VYIACIYAEHVCTACIYVRVHDSVYMRVYITCIYARVHMRVYIACIYIREGVYIDRVYICVNICMSHDTHMNESCHAYVLVLNELVFYLNPEHACILMFMYTCVRHVTHMNESCHTYE